MIIEEIWWFVDSLLNVFFNGVNDVKLCTHLISKRSKKNAVEYVRILDPSMRFQIIILAFLNEICLMMFDV